MSQCSPPNCVACCSLNELDSGENTRSAVAEEGCISRISLQADDHFGNSSVWFCHHSILLTTVDTPSANAMYLGSSAFKPSI